MQTTSKRPQATSKRPQITRKLLKTTSLRPKSTKKRPQMATPPQQTTIGHKQATTNHPRTTKNYQPTAKKYQKAITNGYTSTSNRKADVQFLLPAPGNYKDHLDFEKHMLSVRGDCLLLSQFKQNRICLFWQAQQLVFQLSTRKCKFLQILKSLSSHFINKYDVPLSISYGLVALDQQVECSLI